MGSRKLLTIFGATGNQGGSILDVVLASSDLKEKYSLRGITRDPSSGKSKTLADKGVEMVKAELDDIESIKAAVKGSYGVFGVTDFWSILDKGRELQQGKNLFEASKAEGVKHFIFSSLPSADKMSGGKYKNVDHFESKYEVMEYAEANKSEMLASYFQPAMFIEGSANARMQDGKPTVALPFKSENIAWPLLAPRQDSGKYIMGLFEGGESANGIAVHGVSAWVTPKEAVAALSKTTGQEVVFNSLPADVFLGILTKSSGEQVAKELTEMMEYISEYSYYGKGEEQKQKEHDKWLVPGMETTSYESWAKASGPKEFK